MSLKRRLTWLWLLAGVLIGVSITLLIMGLALKKTDKLSVTSEKLLEKTSVAVSDLRKINSDITTLTQKVDALNEKTRTGNTPSPPSEIKQTGISEPRHIIQHKKYTVYLHYSDPKNKRLMENFSAFLEQNGFQVSGIQRVDYNNQDIRFFHDQDKNGALLLKKRLTEFIQPVENLDENKIKVINLSRKYPEAQKGLLEVWVDF